MIKITKTETTFKELFCDLCGTSEKDIPVYVGQHLKELTLRTEYPEYQHGSYSMDTITLHLCGNCESKVARFIQTNKCND